MIPPEDLQISFYPDRGRGGQYCGYPTGVKIEHLPTGTIAISQFARSQHKNRNIALAMIEEALTNPNFK